jgi:hemolysin activation/secretion protein
MKIVRVLMPVSVSLAASLVWSTATFAEEVPGPEDNPGVELRELQEINPNQYRAPKPLKFTVPETAPMKALPDTEIAISSFAVNGNTAFDDAELLAMLESYKGTITFQKLFEAVTTITDHYRSNGYMVARAYVPEQEVSDGSVEITVLEGVLGDIHVTGDEVIKPERVVKHMEHQVRTGTINEKDMEYGTLLLNDLPGSSASVILKPGTETGLSDIELNVTDEGRYDFAIDYNNFGAPVTGEHRFGAQIGVNNLFKAGDRFSLRPIVSDSGDTKYGSLGFNMPVFTPATKVGIRFSHLLSELGEEFELLKIENTATTVSLDASHAFIRSRNKNLYATFNYDMRTFERLCGYCEETGIPVVEDADYDLDAIQLGVNGDLRDERWGGGINTWYATVRNGLSDVELADAGIKPGITTTSGNIINGGDRIEGKFTSLRLGAQRLQRINEVLSFSAKLDLQHSGDDLDSAERISLGGPSAVRAYRPSEALGDKGAVLQTELRYQVNKIKNRYDWLSSFETYLLIDAGSSELNDNANVVTRDLTQQRTGWGVGVRIKGSDKFHIDIVGAKRITDRVSLVDQPDDEEANFWVQAIYWF